MGHSNAYYLCVYYKIKFYGLKLQLAINIFLKYRYLTGMKYRAFENKSSSNYHNENFIYKNNYIDTLE